MTFEEIWRAVPGVLSEMTTEFVRKANEHFINDPTSQVTACSLLALRELSLLRGAEQLLKPDTFDSYDVLMRAFMETHNLLSTFRFDDEQKRVHIGKWFANKGKDTWQANNKEIETFLTGAGAYDLQLARQWGIFSGLSHPTAKAAHNSTSILARTTLPEHRREDLSQAFREKRADYCSSLGGFFITATYDLEGWIDRSEERRV